MINFIESILNPPPSAVVFRSTSVLALARTRSKLPEPPTCSKRCSPEEPANTLRVPLLRKSKEWEQDSMQTIPAKDNH